MESKGISHTQLTALLWAGALAPAAELLPTVVLPEAGRGSWLAPLAAIPLVLCSGWLVGQLADGEGLASGIRNSLGPVVGRIVLLLYIGWAVLLLALRLRLCAQRLLATGERDGALWIFLLGAAVLVVWMGMGRLPAFARAGQLFLAILLAAGAAVLLLSLSRVELERILPLWREELWGGFRGALSTAGTLGWVFYGGFLLERGGAKRPGRWYWPAWGIGGCALLALAQGIILGNLGTELAGRLDSPFFTLAKSVGVEGAFQRVESVIAAIWTLADLALGVLLLFAIRAMGRPLLPKGKESWVAGGTFLLALGLAFALFTGRSASEWNRTWVPAGNLLLGILLPIIMVVWNVFCGKWRKRSTSCGQ